MSPFFIFFGQDYITPSFIPLLLQILRLWTIDDDVPELSRNCTIAITDAAVMTAGVGSAVVDQIRASASVVILENDYARGLFSISNSPLHPQGMLRNVFVFV